MIEKTFQRKKNYRYFKNIKLTFFKDHNPITLPDCIPNLNYYRAGTMQLQVD